MFIFLKSSGSYPEGIGTIKLFGCNYDSVVAARGVVVVSASA